MRNLASLFIAAWLILVSPQKLCGQPVQGNNNQTTAQGRANPKGNQAPQVEHGPRPIIEVGSMAWAGAIAGAVGGVIVGLISLFTAWRQRVLEKANHLRELALQAAVEVYKSQEWHAKFALDNGRQFEMRGLEGFFIQYMLYADRIKGITTSPEHFERTLRSLAEFQPYMNAWQMGEYGKPEHQKKSGK